MNDIEYLTLDYLNDLYKSLRVIQVLAGSIDREINHPFEVLVRLISINKYIGAIRGTTISLIANIEEIEVKE